MSLTLLYSVLSSRSAKERFDEAEVKASRGTDDIESRYGDDKRRRGGRRSALGWVALISMIAIELLFSVLATYLSWTSNSLIGYNFGLKLLFALFAFLSSIIYIFSHCVHKIDLISRIHSLDRVQRYSAPPALPALPNSPAPNNQK